MRFLATIAVWVLSIPYSAMKMFLPLDRRKIVFLSRQSDEPSRDFRLLIDELRSQEPSLTIVVRAHTVGRGLSGKLRQVPELFAQMYHLATASVCVIDCYILPVSVLDHRPELFVLQMWHALGPIKRFGLQSLDLPSGRSSSIAKAMKMHRNYDAVLCGGPGGVAAFAEAFGVPSSAVLPLGLPRMDFLLDVKNGVTPTDTAAVRDLVSRNPRLAETGRKIVLYAPTFRGKQTAAPLPRQVEAFTRVVNAFEGDEFTLVVKPHDLESARLSGGHVVDATGVDVLQLLAICDVVVTDYSAVTFEAAVLDKPVYYYVYDIDEYEREQGLNINPLEQMPDAASREIVEIVDRIRAADYNPETARSFKERYVKAADGHCTQRIARLVTDHLSMP